MHVQYKTHTDVQQRACHNYVASMAKPVGWMWGYTHTHFIQAKEDERNPSMYLFISFSLFQWWQIYSATVPFPFIVSGFVSGEPPPPSVGERRNGVSTDGDEEGKENENRKYEGRLWIKSERDDGLRGRSSRNYTLLTLRPSKRNLVLHQEPSSPINILWSEKRHICTKQTHH